MRQFRYVLFSLALTLLVGSSLMYSEGATAQSNEQPNPTEQSSETPNPLESEFTALEKRVTSLERSSDALVVSHDALVDSLDNPFQTYVMIFGALIILVFAVAVVLILWKIQKQQNRFQNSEQQWQSRFNDSEQRWEAQLKHVHQQRKDNTQKLEEMVANHSTIRNEQENFQNTLSKLGNRLDGFELTLADLDSDSVPDPLKLETIVQEARTQVEALAHAYENGERIDCPDIENRTPSQNALRILNWIVLVIEDWESDLKQSGTANSDLIQSLGYANQTIKEKLKEIRGQAPSLPTSLDLDSDASNDVAYNEYNTYVSKFEGMLIGYQQGLTVDVAEYDQFIPQFIKDRLFNGVARFIQFDQLPDQLNEFLQFVGYKVVPIEIGKTQADARVHTIQGSRQTNAEPGTVVEVILPGLQRIDDGEIIQKPVVIRGE